MTTELCENCGKPKEEHYFELIDGNLIDGFCYSDIQKKNRFTPQPQDVSNIEGERNDLAVYNAGFQKGKLEQKKEEFAFLNGVLKLPEVWALVVAKRLKQLQKEIGGKEK